MRRIPIFFRSDGPKFQVTGARIASLAIEPTTALIIEPAMAPIEPTTALTIEPTKAPIKPMTALIHEPTTLDNIDNAAQATGDS